MTIEASPARWQVPRRLDFVLASWPDGAVVYDEANGDIHALTSAAGQVLDQILENGIDDPLVLLRSMAHEAPTPEDLASWQVLLQQFEALGFIERVKS